MTQARKKHSDSKSPPLSPSRAPKAKTSTGRRRLRRVLLGVAGAIVLVLGWYGWRWYTAPAPPVVSFADVDPAVQEVIEKARREVWWHPRSAAAWGRLGQLLRAHGYRAEANVCFAHAERFDPNEPRWPYLQGVSLQSEDPETAIRHLQRAAELCGRVPDAPRLMLAETCLQLGRLGDAEAHFRRVLEHDPDNARAHLGLGRLACERGQARDGLAHLSRAAPNRLTQKAASVLLARIYRELGDTAAADRERERGQTLPHDPPWPDPFVEEIHALNIGKQARLALLQTLGRQGRFAEAASLAEKLKEDYPDIYWLVEGRQQMHKGNWPAAERALRQAMQLAPESVEAPLDLGMLLFKQANYRAAAESFHQVTKLEPEYGPAYRRLGECHAKLGERAEALRAFRTAARYMPHDADTHRELGALLAQEGQLAEARTHLERALELQPADAKARQLLEEVSKRLP